MEWRVSVEITRSGTTDVEVEADTEEDACRIALAEADEFDVDFEETDRRVEEWECLTRVDDEGVPVEEPEDARMRRLGMPMLPIFAEAS
jgi:hypothetical protein